MENVFFSGIKELSLSEKLRLQDFASKYYEKIKRMIKNELRLKIHVKCHNVEGNKKKYSIHVQAIAPTRMFTSTRGVAWTLEKASHKAFLEIEHQIEHHMKIEGKKQIQKPSLVKNKVPTSRRKINRIKR